MSLPNQHPTPRNPAPLKRLGRYELFEKVASGGMATVYVGRALGSGGFERVVAVKVCHEHLRENEQFVTMFLDEARLSAKIRHPNVVGVIDASDVDGLYLVMDYVEGAALVALLRSAAGRKTGLPHTVASRIVVDALLGLHAAHELTDAAGNPYGIVHRDVSPPNILVGLDGITRIADFGVAKAAARVTETRDGQLKGKLAYMAPEQFDGIATVQSDIFAAGVVMWECLVGSRLFPGNTDAEIMRSALGSTIRRPSAVRADVPRALDDIVLRALDRDPDRRFATAAEFAEAIEDSGAGIASARAVTTYLKKDLGEWLASREGQLRTFLAADVPSSPGVDSGVVARDRSDGGRARAALATQTPPPPPESTGHTQVLEPDDLLEATTVTPAPARVFAPSPAIAPSPRPAEIAAPVFAPPVTSVQPRAGIPIVAVAAGIVAIVVVATIAGITLARSRTSPSPSANTVQTPTIAPRTATPPIANTIETPTIAPRVAAPVQPAVVTTPNPTPVPRVEPARPAVVPAANTASPHVTPEPPANAQTAAPRPSTPRATNVGTVPPQPTTTRRRRPYVPDDI